MGHQHLYYGFALIEVAEPSTGLSSSEADHIIWARSLRDAEIVEQALNARAANKLIDQFSSKWSFKLKSKEPVGACLGIELEIFHKEHRSWSKRRTYEKMFNLFRRVDPPSRSVLKCKRMNSLGSKTPLYFLEIL